MSAPTNSTGTKQVLDEHGNVLPDATVPDLTDEALVALYRDMVLARSFDERAVKFQRRGDMGTYASMYGHEAAQVGSVHAIADDDWLVHSYREHGATIAHGLPPENILIYHMGHESANNPPDDVYVFPICGTVAGQIPHAVGMAWAAHLSGDDRTVLCHFGDGATSEGDFHEALNFAGVFDVPVVFFCNNNQWAISTPVERQTAAETIVQKATAYGFDGVQVDGMDPLAVYQATSEAVRRTKAANGDTPRPTLIEAKLYRLGAHNTADDPSSYREDPPGEWARKDPVPRYEAFLRDRGLLDEDRQASLKADIDDVIETAFEAAQSLEDPDVGEMFEHVYQSPPGWLREQRDDLRRLVDRYGEQAFHQRE